MHYVCIANVLFTRKLIFYLVLFHFNEVQTVVVIFSVFENLALMTTSLLAYVTIRIFVIQVRGYTS